jgi:hypothetical protein
VNPLWTLAPVSLLLGGATMWIFRRTADVAAIGETVRRIQAYLLEFWLFVDEPSLVWKSWAGLLSANARFYRLLALPLLVILIPMTPVYFLLDAVYGTSALPVGRAALVTLAMHQPLDAITPELIAPDGVTVESPGVRVFSERQVSWRIRPVRPVSGDMQWSVGDQRLVKTMVAGEGFRYHAPKSTRGLLDWIGHPAAPLLPAGPVDWIEISYPPAVLEFIGLQAHWSVWFGVLSIVGALVFRRIRRIM